MSSTGYNADNKNKSNIIGKWRTDVGCSGKSWVWGGWTGVNARKIKVNSSCRNHNIWIFQGWEKQLRQPQLVQIGTNKFLIWNHCSCPINNDYPLFSIQAIFQVHVLPTCIFIQTKSNWSVLIINTPHQSSFAPWQYTDIDQDTTKTCLQSSTSYRL